ncbi:hypothetical protein WKW79_34715 [Variovorax robiniae]|uniref:Copper-binding protein n=1 Tax=Variovorax robiniae TaxID=1836199 RepID=A0ABU8XIS3_9BURK
MALLGTLLQPAISKDNPAHAMAASTAPGTGTITEVVRVSGVVEAIDLPTRHVVLKNSHGKLIAMAIGPEARNLEQVKVGDQVRVSYAQALTLTLMKDGKELRSKVETPSGARSAQGERPAGVLGQKVEVTADVTAVNKKSRVITLRGPEHEIDLKVRDPEQLKLIKVGDQLHAVYTEAVALSVDPAAKK